jgi:hypothetical protein
MTDPTAPDAPAPTDPNAPAEPEAQAEDEPDAWRGFGRPAEGQPDTETFNAAPAAE